MGINVVKNGGLGRSVPISMCPASAVSLSLGQSVLFVLALIPYAHTPDIGFAPLSGQQEVSENVRNYILSRGMYRVDGGS